jgi:hypothetical protein
MVVNATEKNTAYILETQWPSVSNDTDEQDQAENSLLSLVHVVSSVLNKYYFGGEKLDC